MAYLADTSLVIHRNQTEMEQSKGYCRKKLFHMQFLRTNNLPSRMTADAYCSLKKRKTLLPYFRPGPVVAAVVDREEH
jgi:hypothetical protein